MWTPPTISQLSGAANICSRIGDLLSRLRTVILVWRHARRPDARRVLLEQPIPRPHHRRAPARLEVPGDAEPVERLGRQRARSLVGHRRELGGGLIVAGPGD